MRAAWTAWRPLAATMLLTACSAFGDDAEIFQVARLGRAESVRKLLAAKPALVNKTDAHGRTALHYAANAETAQVLITFGADVNAAMLLPPTPLYLALEANRGDVAKVLLANGAKVSDMGRLLRDCAKGGWERAIEALVESGVPVDAAEADTHATPLHVAVLHDRVKAAEMLLAKGADPNVRLSERTQVVRGRPTKVDPRAYDVSGVTPLRLAKSEQMAALLRQHGARE